MTDEKITDLDKRVGSLETYFKVGLLVAAIFGIGGGFGAVALNSARTEIADLEQSVSTLKEEVASAQTDLLNVTSALSETMAEHLATLERAKSDHLGEIESNARTAESGISELHSNLEASLARAVDDEISSQLVATIDPRFSAIETALSRHQVLAVVTVLEARLVSGQSSTGVRYNRQSGVVTFPNPDNSEYLVVVGDYGAIRSDLEYRTDTNFLRSYLSSTEFRVWKTTLDTGDRNAAPNGFTALILRVNG